MHIASFAVIVHCLVRSSSTLDAFISFPPYDQLHFIFQCGGDVVFVRVGKQQRQKLAKKIRYQLNDIVAAAADVSVGLEIVCAFSHRHSSPHVASMCAYA